MIKEWKVIDTNLSRGGWDWACIPIMDSEGRDIFVVQAERDGKRFVLRSEEKLVVFVQLERAIYEFALDLIP